MRNVSSAYPSIEYVNISSVSLEPPLTALDDLLTRFYLSKFVPLLSGNDNEALFRASRKRITRPSGERNVLPVMTVKILWRNRKRIMAGKRRETPFLFNTRAGISSKGKSVGSFNNGGVVVVKERPRFYATCRSKERHETWKNKRTRNPFTLSQGWDKLITSWTIPGLFLRE